MHKILNASFFLKIETNFTLSGKELAREGCILTNNSSPTSTTNNI